MEIVTFPYQILIPSALADLENLCTLGYRRREKNWWGTGGLIFVFSYVT